MAVPLAIAAKGDIFGGLKRCVLPFRVVGVALRDIVTFLIRCRKSSCVTGAIALRYFQKTICAFRGRGRTLKTFMVILSGRRNIWGTFVFAAAAFSIGMAARGAMLLSSF